jgi:hypothetical protein
MDRIHGENEIELHVGDGWVLGGSANPSDLGLSRAGLNQHVTRWVNTPGRAAGPGSNGAEVVTGAAAKLKDLRSAVEIGPRKYCLQQRAVNVPQPRVIGGTFLVVGHDVFSG